MVARRGTYIRESPLLEISASKEDTYYSFVERAAEFVSLDKPAEDSNQVMVLFRPVVGSIVPDSDLVIKEVSRPWTLGNYIQKSHKSSETLKFGVGLVSKEVAVSVGINLEVNVHNL